MKIMNKVVTSEVKETCSKFYILQGGMSNGVDIAILIYSEGCQLELTNEIDNILCQQVCLW